MSKHESKLRQYSIGEEIASAVLHSAGIILGLVGIGIMLVFAGQQGDGYKIAASIIYCLAMILEYSASTLYHSLTNLKAKHIFKVLDHAAIYLLIAGTYTPFCLVTLRDEGGIWMLAVVWALALVGMATEALWVFRPKWVSVVVYMAMGWLIVFKIGPLVQALDPVGLGLLIAGGLAYSIGTFFYVFKKIPFLHAVWHGWVLLGTFLHFFAVLIYVIIGG